mgnify:CR=1 FL=1
MTEREYEDWMILPAERFCHRTSYDVRSGIPTCDWNKCPRKVGMDCYLPVRTGGEQGKD